MPGSSAGFTPLRRVMPNAHTRLLLERLGRDPLKELRILGVRKRVAALDEIEAELVEPAGDEQLVLQARS